MPSVFKTTTNPAYDNFLIYQGNINRSYQEYINTTQDNPKKTFEQYCIANNYSYTFEQYCTANNYEPKYYNDIKRQEYNQAVAKGFKGTINEYFSTRDYT